jgi:poly(A)-specific ribonuclease
VSTEQGGDDEGFYETKCWNVPIFPRKAANDERPVFTCQPSSLEFLSSNGFDFSKWIGEGVSYLSKADEARFDRRQANSGGSEQASSIPLDTLRPRDSEFLTGLIARAQKIVSGESDSGAPDKTFLTSPLNGFQRRLAYQELGRLERTVVTKATEVEDADLISHAYTRRLRVRVFASEAEKTALVGEKDRERREEAVKAKLEAVGFRAVIDIISEARVPVVGHNCLTDLLHFFHKFEATLPESVGEWTGALHRLFPCVIDTKWVIYNTESPATEAPAMPSSALGDAYKSVGGIAAAAAEEGEKTAASEEEVQCQVYSAARPSVRFADGFTRYDANSEAAHEAGYDGESLTTYYCTATTVMICIVNLSLSLSA